LNSETNSSVAATELTGNAMPDNHKINRAGAVAFLTRLAGKTLVKDPNKVSPGLTWTALDVGGPCVETFGMISDHGSQSEFLNLGHPTCGRLGKPKLLPIVAGQVSNVKPPRC
jgi:hypothetical protein